MIKGGSLALVLNKGTTKQCPGTALATQSDNPAYFVSVGRVGQGSGLTRPSPVAKMLGLHQSLVAQSVERVTVNH